MPPSQPRRILYFLHGGGVGGASISLLTLLGQMDRRLYEPLVVFLSHSRMVDIFREAGVATMVEPSLDFFSHTTGERLHLGNPRSLRQAARYLPSLWRARALVQRLRPALVHCNSSTLSAEVIGAKLAGARVVWHIREHVVPGLVGLRRTWHYRVARRHADAMIFILESEARRFACPDKSTVIANSVDLTRFNPDLREQARRRQPGRPPTVVFLGGVTPIKGAREFVWAYPAVRQALPEARFVLAGAAGGERASTPLSRFKRLLYRAKGRVDYLTEVTAFASRHCGEGVRFLGVVEDVPALLAEADLVVFPSTEPHFARPAIEAGAMGLPVVASDIDGPRELVLEGRTGLLVPPGDPRALARAIIKVLSDPELAARMGREGRLQAQERFDAQANSQAVFQIYARLLGQTP